MIPSTVLSSSNCDTHPGGDKGLMLALKSMSVSGSVQEVLAMACGFPP
jgi:hypothetical protein